jgi:hypothetical protein
MARWQLSRFLEQVGKWLLILGFILGLMGWWGPSVEAEPGTPVSSERTLTEPSPALASPADANDIPSETVSRFVTAYLAVVQLIESEEASLQRAETDTESQQMQQEIQAKAIALIRDNDLTLAAYWELLGLANSDPEFRERVLAQVEEASL